MDRIILFGASRVAKAYLMNPPRDTVILAVADNRCLSLHSFCGHSVIAPEGIKQYDADYIVIAIDDLKEGNEREVFNIYRQLSDMGISDDRIVLQSFKYMMDHPQHKPRTNFIKDLPAVFAQQQVDGSVAECGVYRGWFSGIISCAFRHQPLYLFDTFEGFSEEDVESDSVSAADWVKNGANERLRNTSEELVRLRCYNRARLRIRRGYVPETLVGIEDSFCFVNLDMDLYNPQLQALEFFGRHMVRGGVILMHDYFSKKLGGTSRAVAEFSQIEAYCAVPIGDSLSIALIRK